ncbi:hypothetical protein ER13_06095 [Brevundimonas sp. EAKA]|nr:hypothetical protein ER13_06095 [Brevundimonas sp. EAKA]
MITATLLYVEDELLLHTVLETGLDDAGFRVVAVASGEEGLEVLRERPEIVGLITDVNLGPGLDGWGVARKARELNPTIPVIYVSGKDGHDWSAQGVPQSVMIAKPFAVAQVVVAMANLLNQGAALEAGSA